MGISSSALIGLRLPRIPRRRALYKVVSGKQPCLPRIGTAPAETPSSSATLHAASLPLWTPSLHMPHCSHTSPIRLEQSGIYVSGRSSMARGRGCAMASPMSTRIVWCGCPTSFSVVCHCLYTLLDSVVIPFHLFRPPSSSCPVPAWPSLLSLAGPHQKSIALP